MQITFDPLNIDERNAVAAFLRAEVSEPKQARKTATRTDAPAPTAPPPAPTPAPVAAPAPAPSPAAEAATTAEAATYEQARAALVRLSEHMVEVADSAKARETITKLLAEVGASTIKDVKQENFGTLIKRAAEVMAQHGAA